MRKILVIDDDPATLKIVSHILQNDFKITCCENFKQADEALATENFDLALIDRTLPDGDGLELCKRIRNERSLESLPVVFLTSLVSESDKVLGFYSGADDYITKPFSPLELKARVEARLRHVKKRLSYFDLEVDLENYSVQRRNGPEMETIDLTPIEFKLFVYLLKNRDKVLEREQLIAKVWGGHVNVTDRVVDAHISHLRKKFLKSSVKFESYRGAGYRLVG